LLFQEKQNGAIENFTISFCSGFGDEFFSPRILILPKVLSGHDVAHAIFR